jgi:hypothetical protein
MSKKLLILVASPDSGNPDQFSVPLFRAMVAAMSHGIDVEMTALSVVPGMTGDADKVMFNVHQHRIVNDVIRPAGCAGF